MRSMAFGGMKTVYFIGMFALMTVAIFLILKYGVKPQPVGIMKPSHFTGPEEIGAVVYRRFYVELEDKKIMMFGVPPQPVWHQDIVRGFLKAALLEKRPFEAVIMEEQMPPLDLFSGLPEMEIVKVASNTPAQAEFIEAVDRLRASGKRTLIYTASVFSSHLLVGNPVNRYESLTGNELFTITSAPLALSHDQEALIDPPCVGSERDHNGTADLGCAILQAGRRFYRKRLVQDRYVSVMLRHGAHHDYLLMTSEPGQDQAAERMNAGGVSTRRIYEAEGFMRPLLDKAQREFVRQGPPSRPEVSARRELQ